MAILVLEELATLSCHWVNEGRRGGRYRRGALDAVFTKET